MVSLFRKAGLFPDVAGIQAQLNEKFDKLYAVLVEIRDLIQTLVNKGGPA